MDAVLGLYAAGLAGGFAVGAAFVVSTLFYGKR